MQRFFMPLILLSLLVFLVSLALCLTIETDWAASLIYLMLLAPLTFGAYKLSKAPLDSRLPLVLFMTAFIWKMIGSALRYWTLFEFYGGTGDSVAYHEHGLEFAQTFGLLDLSILDKVVGMSQGTAWVVLLTSTFYSVLPPSLLGSFFLFASLAFLGSFLYYRAFCLAFPDSQRRWFLFLVFFLPSFLYWPSSLGKDALIYFASGLVAYGLVRFMRLTDFVGLVIAGAGLSLVLVVRPHVATVMVLALGAAYVLSLKLLMSRGFIGWVLAAAIIAGGGYFVLQYSSQYFLSQEADEVSWEEVENFYQKRQVSSATGKSKIEAPSILNPAGPFYALATVVFRPFPWEAHNTQALITSMESVFWLGLMWYRRKVFWARLRSITKDPWVGFALIYSLLMVMALTTAGNLGIIARQRVMFLPFLFMLFG